jgi:hypothetical protein
MGKYTFLSAGFMRMTISGPKIVSTDQTGNERRTETTVGEKNRWAGGRGTRAENGKPHKLGGAWISIDGQYENDILTCDHGRDSGVDRFSG